MGDHQGFQTDPRALHTFGTDFQHDLDVHLAAEKLQTLHLFSEAGLFGTQTASPTVHRAAVDYYTKLIQLFDLLDTLIDEGATMARAAHDIAAAYTEADTESSTDLTSRAAR
ncbi:hypothetical protein [Dactylosporangium sp. NPDC051541]|uniref:hypothetical protein n=1 Tax=Dactylosporangium sp. NPDC051541 TaxID=3363977 RepID=UPI003789DD94